MNAEQFLDIEDAPGLEGIGKFESGNTYNPTPHKVTGAEGKYQVLPSNWPQWAQDAGLSRDAPKTPENQEIIARNKWNEYMGRFGDKALAAAAWFAGPKRAEALQRGKTDVLNYKDANGVTVAKYIEKTTGNKYQVQSADDFLNAQDADSFLDAEDVTTPKKGAWQTVKDIAEPYVGAVEAGANVVTGMGVGFPAAVLGGVAKGITSGLGEGIKTYKEISESPAFTYQPKTESGKAIAEGVGKGVSFFTKPYEESAKKIGTKIGGENVGELAEIATGVAIPAVFGGAYKVGRAKVKGKTATVEELKRTPEDMAVAQERITEQVPKIPERPKTVKAEEFLEKPVETPIPKVETEIKPVEVVQPTLESLEAGVKGGSTKPLGKYAGQPPLEGGSAINIERLDTTNDVKQFIDRQVRVNEEKIGRHTVSWDETRKTAEELGWDWKTMIKQRKGKAYTAAEIDAMRQINMNMATDLHSKIKGLPADRAQITPEMRMDILDTVNNYGEVLNTISSASSEAGRALNIHKRMIANDPEFQQKANMNRVIKTMIDKSGLKKLSDTMLDDLRNVDLNDAGAVNKIIQKYHKASIPDMVYEAWMNSLLSSPMTHGVNALSNTITFLTKPLLETPLTATFELARGKGKQSFYGEIPAEIVGTWQGIKEGTRAALKAWDTGIGSDIWSKTETPFINAIPGETGRAIRIPTRALTAADEFFKSIVYRAELNRQAYSTAAKKGLKGKKRVSRMAELVENPTVEMLEKAHYEALYRTFNKPLGKIGNQLMNIRNSVPFDLGKYIVPFMRTPTNIAKFALERTPANLVKIGYRLKKGTMEPSNISEELAKTATGSLIGASIMTLAVEGYITGGGPKDKKKREAQQKKGWQAYSFKIGDTYYGYSRLEPVGSIIGMTADMYEAIKDPYGEQKDSDGAMFMATKIASSIGKNLTSKTFVKGMSGAIDAISDPARYGNNFVKNYAGTLIPSIVAQTARATDPIYRESKTLKDYMKSRIPVLSQDREPKYDIEGEPAKKAGNELTRFVLPIPLSKEVAQ